MKVKEYQATMKRLYNVAIKYPDDELAKAIADVRDLVVEYKNALDSVNPAITERVEEVKKLAEFHSYEVPIEYGDGIKATEKMCPLYEINSILNRTFGVFKKGE